LQIYCDERLEVEETAELCCVEDILKKGLNETGYELSSLESFRGLFGELKQLMEAKSKADFLHGYSVMIQKKWDISISLCNGKVSRNG